MKKIITVILAVVSLTALAGCKNKDKNDPPLSQATSAVSSSAAPDKTAPDKTAPDKTAPDDKTVVQHISEEEALKSGVNEESVEKDFTGTWRAVLTTTENKVFESMEVIIHYDSYAVSMTFADSEFNTRIEGTYKIKDGVLIFDDNFADCTAYFCNGDDDTLVIDNGISLMLCEKQELEEDMH